MKNNPNNLERITELEKLATEVLTLKKQHRQRRPIVIEFCGSPKAGKTSCINSLNIFLKRNGFKTSVLTERASISPISDKHNPIFNVWTCTSAINEINEKMDKAQHGEDIDVIISDRGIFDAICWFKWLKSQNNMHDYEYQILTEFSTLYRWQKNIDLVYVFVVSPEESIKREYANLLTQKRGSIMREDVLEQYLTAIEDVMKEYEFKFRAIHKIDTSNKLQNDVGYEVTLKTLEVLKNMLIEKIGYVEKDKIKLNSGMNNFDELSLSLNKYTFNNRDIVESDPNLIQPISIAVITNHDKSKVLCIKKTQRSTSNNSPEFGKLLLYAGGHIRQEDECSDTKEDFLLTAQKALEREIFEELGISYCLDETKPFVIYTPENSEKSKQHLAVGWTICIDEETKFNLDSYEITQRKGTSKSGSFISFVDLGKSYLFDEKTDFESWSREILINLFADKCSQEFIDSLKNGKKYSQIFWDDLDK